MLALAGLMLGAFVFELAMLGFAAALERSFDALGFVLGRVILRQG